MVACEWAKMIWKMGDIGERGDGDRYRLRVEMGFGARRLQLGLRVHLT